MTLPESELKKVEDLIVDVANGVEDVGALLYHLKRLRLRYGEHPIILSTEADYVDSVVDRLRLYVRAVELSEKQHDVACLTQSAESIIELYIDEICDIEQANIWYSKLTHYINKFGSEYTLSTMSHLKSRLDSMGT